MIKVLTYYQIDQQQWQALIDRSPYATWFQTPEAYEFYTSVSTELAPFAVGVLASPKSSPEGKDFQPTPSPSLKGGEHASFAKTWGAHTADSTQYDLLKENAVNNRKNPTEAESVLWDMLKGNNIDYHFRRQHIILDYIVDFICLDKGLIIELDGGYHNDPQQKEYDKARTAHLQRLGYTELRFKNEELLCNPDAVIQKITDTLNNLPSLQVRAGDRLVGVIVGYITLERNPLKQFLTRRAIIIGGPLLANDISDEALSALLTSLTKLPSLQGGGGGRLTPIYIESRNFHDYSKWRNIFEANGFAYQPHLNFHVDTSSVEVVDKNLGKSRKRDIRTTIRDGVTPVYQPTTAQVKEYYQILQNLYTTKVKTPLFSWNFFEQLHRTEHARFILTEYQGRIIGGTVCVELPNRALYEWFACGEDGVYDHIYPSCYATYLGIKYAAESGCQIFDMMGAGKPEEAYGVRDFKAEFGGELVEHGRFLYVRKPLLYWIGKMGVRWLKRRK